MKNIEKKWINNIGILLLLLLLLFIPVLSCTNDKYTLKSEKDIEITFDINHFRDTILIVENAVNGSQLIQKEYRYVKMDKSYYLDVEDRKPFFSLTSYKYSNEDSFSLLDDSIFVGQRYNELFYTEIKSNNKPVNKRFFYNKEFKIKKIIFVIGCKEYIYE